MGKWDALLSAFKKNPTKLLQPTCLAARGKEVFAHSDTSLKYIKTYGFDYDYTMVHYSDNLLSMVWYFQAKNSLATYIVTLFFVFVLFCFFFLSLSLYIVCLRSEYLTFFPFQLYLAL